jgi:hypothetical protein
VRHRNKVAAAIKRENRTQEAGEQTVITKVVLVMIEMAMVLMEKRESI